MNTATVDYVKGAKTGDTIWIFDSQKARYVDGKYQGRGVWELRMIEAETRRSFTVYRLKFDRVTGAQMATGDYAGSYSIAGQAEYEGSVWMDKHRHALTTRVGRETDIAVLKQIAALVGYEDRALASDGKRGR